MHEWALAEAVIQTALDVASREGFRAITRIEISLGELQNIEQEIFRFALSEIIKMYPERFKDTKIDLIIEKTLFRCRACGNEWNLKEIKGDWNEDVAEAIHFIPELSHSFIRCPRCNSPDFEVLKGRGVSITSLVGEKDGDRS